MNFVINKINFLAWGIMGLIVFSSCSSTSYDLIIIGGWRFNNTTLKMEPNTGIYIKEGLISEVAEESNQKAHTTIQLSDDDYILPGFIDLHAHYRVSYNGVAYDDTVAMPRLFLANGVTSTFPAGEIEPEKMWHLSEQIENGKRTGARILHSGPYFGTAAPDWDANFTDKDIEERVDYWAKRGAMGFKAKNITPEHLKVLIQRAHSHNLTVTGHLNSGVGNSVNPQEAIIMGIDRIEHFLGGRLLSDSAHAYASLQDLNPDDPALDDIIQLYKTNQVYFDATLGTYGAIGGIESSVFEDWAEENKYLTPFTRSLVEKHEISEFNKTCKKIYPVKQLVLKRFYDAGGLITVGTDRPLLLDNYLGSGLGGFFIHRELEAMVETGIPSQEVLNMVTLQNAVAFKLDSLAGSIESGKWADMLITKGNPVVNIRNTRNVYKVIKGGKVYDTKYILEYCIDKLGLNVDDL
ncbi:MAG: amidohydrolase family protein [Cyclobacteriaceae bacterium]|nr:amidohydrolase family protein [Cyclobacteriaceae bacterium]